MNMTTTDLSQFGNRERAMAEELLHAWNNNNLPEEFYDDEVIIVMNTCSGNVFLTNSDYQVAMMNGDHEGFKEEFEDCCDCHDCKEIAAA